MTETIEYKGYSIEMWHDEDVESPLEYCAPIEVATFHRRYAIHTQNGKGLAQGQARNILQSRKEYKAWILYGYDHGGLSVSLSNAQYPYNCPWDAGTLGIAYTKRSELRRAFGRQWQKPALKFLESTINSLNMWLAGETYGFTITDSVGEVQHCVGGYIGREYALQDAQSCIDALIAEQQVLANLPGEQLTLTLE